MSYYKTIRICFISLIFTLFSCHAFSSTDYNGDWSDNASGTTRIGNLNISANTISVGDLVTYTVTKNSAAGSMQIYKVNKVSTKTDPFGCGPNGSVTYIIVSPLEDIPGTQQQAIRVFFYGGSTEPNLKEIDDDPAVCLVHSFGRSK